MELYLQFGFGMMQHSQSLVSSWGGGTVILSPRDLNESQLLRVAERIAAMDRGRLLLDPQFYLPHADHERLCSHRYWPDSYQTGVFWQGPSLVELLSGLADLNRRADCAEFILPGLLASSVSEDWLASQQAILEEAQALNLGLPLLSTIALSDDAVRSQEQIGVLLERAEEWQPDGYYLIMQHPHGSYLADDPNWLANVLDVAAGLKLQRARVVMGYCNHQMLIAAAAKVDAIASGTWMNVRSFPPEKFRSALEDDIKQRATWYYCPQALSEYKVTYLDLAFRAGLLRQMAPHVSLDGGYVRNLFSGAQPSAVGLSEQVAFRHYLHCLRAQALEATRDTFDETVHLHHSLLDSAESLLSQLRLRGVLGQLRDFSQILDVNRAALAAHTSGRGPLLRREWGAL